MTDRNRKQEPREEGAAREGDAARPDARWEVPQPDGPEMGSRHAHDTGRDSRTIGRDMTRGDDTDAAESRRRALEDAVADVREPELAAELRAEDNQRTVTRQGQLSTREHRQALRLDESARGLDSSAEAIASTRERVRDLSQATDELARGVNELRARTQRVAKDVRRTEVRGDEP